VNSFSRPHPKPSPLTPTLLGPEMHRTPAGWHLTTCQSQVCSFADMAWQSCELFFKAKSQATPITQLYRDRKCTGLRQVGASQPARARSVHLQTWPGRVVISYSRPHLKPTPLTPTLPGPEMHRTPAGWCLTNCQSQVCSFADMAWQSCELFFKATSQAIPLNPNSTGTGNAPDSGRVMVTPDKTLLQV
jgi:uncharacterized protein YeaC (DUF1315 family)